MIPLQQGPEGWLDIVDTQMLNHYHNLYLFSKHNGKTIFFRLKLINQQGKKYIRCEDGMTGQISKVPNGSPILTIYNNQPALVCLKDYMKPDSISEYWIFEPNLDKNKMELLVDFKANQARVAQLKSYANDLAKHGSNINCFRLTQPGSSIYFSQNQSIIEKDPEEVYQILDYDQKKGLKELKTLKQDLKIKQKELQTLKQEIFSKQQALLQKQSAIATQTKNIIRQIQINCYNFKMKRKHNKVKKPSSSSSGQFLLNAEENFRQTTSPKTQRLTYKGFYGVDNARKKIKSSKDSLPRAPSFLQNFVRRTLQNMKQVASWNENCQLLIASSFKQEHFAKSFLLNNKNVFIYFQFNINKKIG